MNTANAPIGRSLQKIFDPREDVRLPSLVSVGWGA